MNDENKITARLTEVEFYTADIDYDSFATRDAAREAWLYNYLIEKGFDVDREIKIRGSFEFSNFLEFEQEMEK